MRGVVSSIWIHGLASLGAIETTCPLGAFVRPGRGGGWSAPGRE
jgi:hypothetical protein